MYREDYKSTEQKFNFCTHLSDHGVGVAEVEAAWSLEVAAPDLEVGGLLRGVPGQEDIHFCLQLEHWSFLHCEEQIACVGAVPPENFPSVVHAKYLA